MINNHSEAKFIDYVDIFVRDRIVNSDVVCPLITTLKIVSHSSIPPEILPTQVISASAEVVREVAVPASPLQFALNWRSRRKRLLRLD